MKHESLTFLINKTRSINYAASHDAKEKSPTQKPIIQKSAITVHHDEDETYLKLVDVVSLIIFWQIIYALFFISSPSNSSSKDTKLKEIAIKVDNESHLPAIYRQASEKSEHVFCNQVPDDYFLDSKQWNQNVGDYWNNLDPSWDSAMNGFGLMHTEDIDFSSEFLRELRQMFPTDGSVTVVLGNIFTYYLYMLEYL